MKPYEAELRRIIRGSAWLMGILETVKNCDPRTGSSAGRALQARLEPFARLRGDAKYLGDVVFFDPEDLSPERELMVERGLSTGPPDVPWEAKNQAAVHLWYEEKFGYEVPPLNSSEEGIGANPGTATAVGVRLLADGSLYVAAPLGLSDLFEQILRRNPRRVTPELFHKWVVEKGFQEKWPKIRVVEESRSVF